MLRPYLFIKIFVSLYICSFTWGCANAPNSDFAVGTEDSELGKALFDPTDLEGSKADSVSGKKGLPISVDSGATQVWDIRNQWTDTDTIEARKAGMAWDENSGLTTQPRKRRKPVMINSPVATGT